ncbi:hypothetical protein RJZ56_007672 [Blastomyces dermatitidis]|uniref:Uncharacterized protein n=2 Tax=Ajellomyces dermatitidis TaxID=5039 RepID=F2TKL9_AJEDA|nr:uncharacterized protein BDCG_05654 [Blastomyces dermatitidis ER-3]EEQ90534.1 hypothetical protein BDCG_05654 [Blastomyces dermatitidis ER-3]EGE83782.1 hypothetical protein BDDG_06727 [Blastomyces dermatitidis ATCC 18188]
MDNPCGEPNQDAPSRDPRKSTDPLTFDPVRALEEFASHVASIATLSGERARLIKRSQAESTDLRKATDRTFQYPSVAKRLKAGKEELDNELARVDEKLHVQRTMQAELIKELAANFNCRPQEPPSQLDLEHMKRDLQETRAEMRRLRDIQVSITATLDSLKRSAQSNEDKIAYIKRSKSSVETELTNLRSELSTRQDHWNAIESMVTNQAKSIELRDLQQQQTDSHLKLLRDERKSAELTTKAHEEDFSKRLDNLDRMVIEYGKTCKELSEKKESLMRSHFERITNGAPAVSASVEVRNQIQNLRQIQDAKDEAIADELDKYESRIARLEEVVSKLKQMGAQNETSSQALGIGTPHVNAELERLWQAINGLNQQVDSRLQRVENQSRVVEAHQIALHSLETRYNHLSTEPIVRQMVVAMQEMYPHASTVQQEIPNIHEKTNKLASELNSVRNDISTAESARRALINDMTAERDQMTQEISSLRSRIDEIGSVRSKADELEKALTSRMDEVENVVATNLASVMLNFDKRTSPPKS